MSYPNTLIRLIVKPPRGAGPHSLLMETMSVLDLFTGVERGPGIKTYLRLSNHALTS